MKLFRIAAIVSLTAMAGNVIAATDGELGSTSIGSAEINIEKQNAVKITKLNDLDLGTMGVLTASASANDDVCVFSSTGGYSIRITSANGAFELEGGTDDEIPYTLDWTVDGAASAPVVYDTPLTGLAGHQTSVDCEGSTNSNFEVTVTAADFNAAAPGSYTDTLTMVVSPE